MANFFESVFEFLFKYRPVTYTRGEFALGSPYPLLLVLVLAIAAAAFAIVTYRRVGARSNMRDRLVLTAVRVGVVVILMVCLMRPMLVLSTALPQRNFVGILIDDSRSMSINDGTAETRSAVAQKLFDAEKSEIMAELSDKFLVRNFAFSDAAERVGKAADLTFEGSQTKMMAALDRAQQDLSAVPVAGMVVVTDGADNSHSPMSDQLLKLKASGIPVYTVALGSEKFERDIEIAGVESPPSVLKGASVIVDLQVTQTGYAGQTVPLVVEDAGRVVSTQDVVLPKDGEVVPVRVHVVANDAGPRTYKFRIPAQGGELLDKNNERQAMVFVSDRREKVLYFEGEPRWEVKFLLRALEDDKNLQVVLLQRTAENKFLRRNVDDGEELAGGFPTTREELFKYRSIILGSVEASFFTHDQLQMLADFVSERGGGLLLLGGRHSFSEGGYFGTPLADALPIIFGPRRMTENEDEGYFSELKVALTPAGMIHPATRLAPDEKESQAKWLKLPPLSSVNRIDQLKPGATELISGTATRGRERQPVLVYQRYGKGKVIAMPVQDVWMWQMHADMAVDDETHESFWKQIARWLVSTVPGQLNVKAGTDRVAPNEAVVLNADVSDSRYIRINNAKVNAFVSGPGMPEQELPMEWTVDRDGEYRASVAPPETGVYRVRAVAMHADSVLGVDTTFFESAEPREEFFAAQMNAPLLKRIAEETGGKYYTPDKVKGLAEDMTYTKSGAVVVQQLDLWDMPVIFVLLMALLGSEWVYRKLRGLA